MQLKTLKLREVTMYPKIPKDTQGVSGRAGIWTQAHTRIHALHHYAINTQNISIFLMPGDVKIDRKGSSTNHQDDYSPDSIKLRCFCQWEPWRSSPTSSLASCSRVLQGQWSGHWGGAVNNLVSNLGVNNEELERFPRTKSQTHCNCPNSPGPLKHNVLSQ